VRFEALAEIPASEQSSKEVAAQRLKKVLAFEHRIADTRQVDSREILLTENRKKRLSLIALVAINTVLAGAGLVVGWWSGYPTQEGDLRFWLVVNDSKSVLVRIRPLADGNLRIKGVNDKFDATMPVEAFFHSHKWKPIITKEYFGMVTVIMMAILFGVSATMAIYLGITIRRETRLKRVLSLSWPIEHKQASV
jgi:hypothetical protein